MSMKIWKTIIQQRKKVPAVVHDMITGMEVNEKLLLLLLLLLLY